MSQWDSYVGRVVRPQPAVEPGGHLDVEVDPRAGHRGARVGVGPRAGQQSVRDAVLGQGSHGPERVVAVAVGPPGHEHRRDVDPLVARAVRAQPHRAAAPVVAVRVLAQPGQHPGLVLLQPAPPLVLPTVSPDRGDGWQHAHRGHVVAVVHEIDQPQRPAAPVDIVGPPVVAGVDREHRAQRRGVLARDLQRVEAGVRRAEHPDPARAPFLVGQPGDHLDQVGLLLGWVLVGRVARRRAGAAHVEPAHGVPEPVPQVLVPG